MMTGGSLPQLMDRRLMVVGVIAFVFLLPIYLGLRFMPGQMQQAATKKDLTNWSRTL